jgi:hypothetical protein
VHYVFFKCLISTDEILRQIVRSQLPKYDFESGFFGSDDLAMIGFIREEVPVDSYADARPLLLDIVAAHGYALVVIDVFYLPHCPEYRTRHVVHTVVLTEFDTRASEWAIIDDNPASVLCSYRYPERVIAASYDNNTLRRVRYYSDKGFDEDGAALGAARGCADLLATYRDGRDLFARMNEILACPWIAPGRLMSLLHDAFSIYQGSRTGLLEYVSRSIGDPAAESAIRRAVSQATEVQNALLVAKVTGLVDADWMKAACGDLDTAEEALVDQLRAIVAGR